MRKDSLFLPDGSPRYVRCWDNGGKTLDRYTIQFTRANMFGFKGRAVFVSCNANPYTGIGYYGDMPLSDFAKSHGKPITYGLLPEEAKLYIILTYKELWGIAQ